MDRGLYDGPLPLDISVEKLEELRTPAAIWFTQGTMSNSPTRPILIPEGFGPFAGQMLCGEMNRPRIMRLMPEKVNDVMQGAVITFYENGELPSGVHRFAWGSDKSLWTGHTHLSWAGGEGVTRIKFKEGAKPFEIDTVKITKEGFDPSFTDKVTDLGEADLIRYTFAYHADYGSPQIDETKVTYEAEKIGEKSFRLVLDEPLQKDFCYEFRFKGTQGPEGVELTNKLVCYTVREIPE